MISGLLWSSTFRKSMEKGVIVYAVAVNILVGMFDGGAAYDDLGE